MAGDGRRGRRAHLPEDSTPYGAPRVDVAVTGRADTLMPSRIVQDLTLAADPTRPHDERAGAKWWIDAGAAVRL